VETYLVLDDGRWYGGLAAVDHHLAGAESAEKVLNAVEEVQVRPLGGEVADKHARIVRVSALRLEEGLSCRRQRLGGRDAARCGGSGRALRGRGGRRG
jgi:hypothetical protein